MFSMSSMFSESNSGRNYIFTCFYEFIVDNYAIYVFQIQPVPTYKFPNFLDKLCVLVTLSCHV